MKADAASPAATPGIGAADVLQQLLHARAATLARGGALQTAAGLLQASIEAGVERAATLDLLARIRAQAGEWAEAEKLWLQAAHLQPGHAGAAAGLARLRQERQRPRRTLMLAAGGFVLAAVLALVLVAQEAAARRQAQAMAQLRAWLAEREAAAAQQQSKTQQQLEARLAGLAETQQALTLRLRENEARWDRATIALAAIGRTATPLQLAFAVPGVRSAARGSALLLWLEDEAFDGDNRLSDAARSRLRTLARAIVMTQELVVLEVAGLLGPATEPAQAAQRAGLAAGALRQTGLFPRQAIRPTTRAAQEGEPPGAPIVLRLERVAVPAPPAPPTPTN